MAVFPDKHCRAWGGFRQTGELEAVCRGLRGEADWINSSLRLSCSLRGHQGNMEGKENGEALSHSHRTAECLNIRLLYEYRTHLLHN